MAGHISYNITLFIMQSATYHKPMMNHNEEENWVDGQMDSCAVGLHTGVKYFL